MSLGTNNRDFRAVPFRALILDSSPGYTVLPTQTHIPIPFFFEASRGGLPKGENLGRNYCDTIEANYRAALQFPSDDDRRHIYIQAL
jgi:hypothetical protein